MSRTAQEIIVDWYQTGNAALLSHDIEWQVLSTFPSGGRYVGVAAVTNDFFPSVKEIFAKYETIPESFFSTESGVVSRGIYRVTSFDSESVDAEFAHFWTVKNGLITSFRQIADTLAIHSITRHAS